MWELQNGPQNIFSEFGKSRSEGRHQGAITAAVTGIQGGNRGFDRMFEHNGRSILERVSACCGWLNPGNINGKRPKEGACYAHGVNRGSKILSKAWQGSLRGGARTSDLRVTFEYCGRNPRPSENDRG